MDEHTVKHFRNGIPILCCFLSIINWTCPYTPSIYMWDLLLSCFCLLVCVFSNGSTILIQLYIYAQVGTQN